LHGGEHEGVDGEYEVVGVDGAGQTNRFVNRALDIINSIEVEANWIQHSKLQRKTRHTLRIIIIKRLRIETGGPRNKRYPPQHILYHFRPLMLDNLCHNKLFI